MFHNVMVRPRIKDLTLWMKKIIVASKNPVKINSARAGFEAMFLEGKFRVEGVLVPRGGQSTEK